MEDFTLQKFKLLKFLNIIKQKDFYFERFFLQHSSLFGHFCLNLDPPSRIHKCVLFLQEMNNFYPSESSRLRFLQTGVIFILFQSLLTSHPSLALLSTPNQPPNSSPTSTLLSPF